MVAGALPVVVVMVFVVVVVAAAQFVSVGGCEVHLAIHASGAGIWLRPVSSLSCCNEAHMENPDHSGSGPVLRQSVRDAHLRGSQTAVSITRWVVNRYAHLGPEGLAIILEEVAARLSGEAEIFRSGRVR